jgi:hydrogenase nickel incorporation protein HypA/HybF
MHEWALAEAIISATFQMAEKEGLKKVSEVKIKVGELQLIELEILEFALLQLKKDKLRNAKFTVRTENAELKCRVCGHRWVFSERTLSDETAEAIHFVPEIAHTYVKCPKCESPDFEILKGRGVWLETVKGVK